MGSLEPYPDPGAQKWPTKIKLINFIFWSAGCSVLRTQSFSCSLDVLYGVLRISKLQFLIKKKILRKIQLYFFLSVFFGHQNPGSWMDPYRIYLKCWIRIYNTGSSKNNFLRLLFACTENPISWFRYLLDPGCCRRTDLQLYRNLEHQCRLMDVQFLEAEPRIAEVNDQYDLVGRLNSSLDFQHLYASRVDDRESCHL